MKAVLPIFALYAFSLFVSPFQVSADTIDADSFDEAVAEAVELAVAEAIEELATSEEMETLQAQIDSLEAAAEAAESMYTQAEYDAVIEENATLQESNATLEADLASANASSASTDDTWSYDSQREAILSVGGGNNCGTFAAGCMGNEMRGLHIEYLDEDSTPVTMYDIAIANAKIASPAASYPVGSCNGWGTTTWVRHLVEEGVHPQLAVLVGRFGDRYYARGANENNYCDCNPDANGCD